MKTNLSMFERVVRPILGFIIGTIALSQPEIGIVEAIVLVFATFLILNGLLARCYLWHWLGLNTAQNEFELCSRTLRREK